MYFQGYFISEEVTIIALLSFLILTWWIVIAKKGVNSRDSDIRNILRKNDIKLEYNSTNKIQILQSDIGKTKDLETIEKELKNEIKIMISLIDDAEEQLHWKQIYDESKNKEQESMESLLQDLLKYISCVDLS